MIRMEVYKYPHRALRYAIGRLLELSNRTDPTDSNQVSELKMAAQETFELLDMHSADEEQFGLRFLEERRPGSAQRDLEDHKQLYSLLVELRQRLGQYAPGPPVMAWERSLLHFQSRYYAHMLQEETLTQADLHACFSDAELLDHQQQIISSHPPAHMQLWAKYLLPSLPGPERIAFETRLGQRI